MENLILENDIVCAEISPVGAELRRVFHKKRSDELIWSGDPAVWQGTAPILFPIVGRLRNGEYTYQGKSYTMQKHGFARSSVFSVVNQQAESVTLRLTDSEETRAMYPFSFVFDVMFRLIDDGVAIEYVVKNSGSETLLFTLGSHPGIALPQKLTEYSVIFDRPQTLDNYSLENELLTVRGVPYLKNENEIKLTPTLFDHDALIFKDVTCRKIQVKHLPSGRTVEMDTGGAPHLGIWAKPAAQYVCIEPWFSHDDPADTDGTIENKPGILSLAPEQIFSNVISIRSLA